MDAVATSTLQSAVGAKPAEPPTILYATEFGNSERVTSEVTNGPRKMGLNL
jgi:hypothetical protein